MSFDINQPSLINLEALLNPAEEINEQMASANKKELWLIYKNGKDIHLQVLSHLYIDNLISLIIEVDCNIKEEILAIYRLLKLTKSQPSFHGLHNLLSVAVEEVLKKKIEENQIRGWIGVYKDIIENTDNVNDESIKSFDFFTAHTSLLVIENMPLASEDDFSVLLKILEATASENENLFGLQELAGNSLSVVRCATEEKNVDKLLANGKDVNNGDNVLIQEFHEKRNHLKVKFLNKSIDLCITLKSEVILNVLLEKLSTSVERAKLITKLLNQLDILEDVIVFMEIILNFPQSIRLLDTFSLLKLLALSGNGDNSAKRDIFLHLIKILISEEKQSIGKKNEIHNFLQVIGKLCYESNEAIIAQIIREKFNQFAWTGSDASGMSALIHQLRLVFKKTLFCENPVKEYFTLLENNGELLTSLVAGNGGNLIALIKLTDEASSRFKMLANSSGNNLPSFLSNMEGREIIRVFNYLALFSQEFDDFVKKLLNEKSPVVSRIAKFVIILIDRLAAGEITDEEKQLLLDYINRYPIFNMFTFNSQLVSKLLNGLSRYSDMVERLIPVGWSNINIKYAKEASIFASKNIESRYIQELYKNLYSEVNNESGFFHFIFSPSVFRNTGLGVLSFLMDKGSIIEKLGKVSFPSQLSFIETCSVIGDKDSVSRLVVNEMFIFLKAFLPYNSEKFKEQFKILVNFWDKFSQQVKVILIEEIRNLFCASSSLKAADLFALLMEYIQANLIAKLLEAPGGARVRKVLIENSEGVVGFLNMAFRFSYEKNFPWQLNKDEEDQEVLRQLNIQSIVAGITALCDTEPTFVEGFIKTLNSSDIRQIRYNPLLLFNLVELFITHLQREKIIIAELADILKELSDDYLQGTFHANRYLSELNKPQIRSIEGKSSYVMSISYYKDATKLLESVNVAESNLADYLSRFDKILVNWKTERKNKKAEVLQAIARSYLILLFSKATSEWLLNTAKISERLIKSFLIVDNEFFVRVQEHNQDDSFGGNVFKACLKLLQFKSTLTNQKDSQSRARKIEDRKIQLLKKHRKYFLKLVTRNLHDLLPGDFDLVMSYLGKAGCFEDNKAELQQLNEVLEKYLSSDKLFELFTNPVSSTTCNLLIAIILPAEPAIKEREDNEQKSLPEGKRIQFTPLQSASLKMFVYKEKFTDAFVSNAREFLQKLLSKKEILLEIVSNADFELLTKVFSCLNNENLYKILNEADVQQAYLQRFKLQYDQVNDEEEGLAIEDFLTQHFGSFLLCCRHNLEGVTQYFGGEGYTALNQRIMVAMAEQHSTTAKSGEYSTLGMWSSTKTCSRSPSYPRANQQLILE